MPWKRILVILRSIIMANISKLGSENKLEYLSLGTWLALATQPHYEAPCDLSVKHRQNTVIDIEQ